MTKDYIERVIVGEDRGALSWLIRGALWLLSIIYRAGLAVYLWLYSLGIRKRYALSVPVISVGNLTFGGTGKTPAVQTICRLLVQSGKKVVILSRGHGGSAKGALIVSDGKHVSASASEAGDEPVLLALSLPGVPVVVGKDRRVSGKLAVEEFSPDVIVLDDGLQYWQLHRDLDIVLVSAAKPFGSGFVMPMGDLRESVNGLKRAGVVLLNTDGATDIESVEQRIRRIAPGVDIYRCRRTPESFVRISDGEQLALDWVKGRRVLAFCGIGKPQSFIDMLESLGAIVVKQLVFSDHHEYSHEDISLIESERSSSSAEAIVTTQKDLARLGELVRINNLHILVIRLEVEDNIRFANRIKSKGTQTSAKEAVD
ncbi:tetraacyldisaccharide 4'-kinase [bacterium]|nr:tetraacyldisaccharide 4'-kinase [bacterium]